jgi:hypothetical protein
MNCCVRELKSSDSKVQWTNLGNVKKVLFSLSWIVKNQQNKRRTCGSILSCFIME